MKSKLLFCIVLLIGSIGCIGAQTSSYPTKGHVVNNAIPGDNVLRFYRMAIPVTHTAFEESFEKELLGGIVVLKAQGMSLPDEEEALYTYDAPADYEEKEITIIREY